MTPSDSTRAAPRGSVSLASVTRGARYLIVALSTGAVAGLIAKWSDENGPQWLGDLGTELPFWVALATAIGWFASSRIRAAVSAGLFFLAMTAAYYGWAHVALGHPFEPASLIWFALAAGACPLLSAAVNAARPRRTSGPVALGAAAAVVAATGSVRGLWLQVTEGLGEDAPSRAAAGILDVALAVALVLLARTPRGVVVAATAAVLLFWPVDVLYDTVSSRVPLP